MDAKSIRAYMARDREMVAANKRRHHAARNRASGGRSGVAAGGMLRDYVRKIRHGWPTARDRSADLAHHLALKRSIDRAASAFTACAEDLIVMKLLAGRAKDDDDVIAMLAAARKLDAALIRSTLRILERALDRGDLASKFGELATRAGRAHRGGRRN